MYEIVAMFVGMFVVSDMENGEIRVGIAVVNLFSFRLFLFLGKKKKKKNLFLHAHLPEL